MSQHYSRVGRVIVSTNLLWKWVKCNTLWSAIVVKIFYGVEEFRTYICTFKD